MATVSEQVSVDWASWLIRWHRQQERYVPGRAERFALMGDYLARARGDGALRILDCCCGPGSLAQVMLDRFPSARVVAVDVDPWLIEMGRRTITDSARVQWIEADLRREEWTSSLPEAGFDAVVSATALHWFHPDELVRLYGSLAHLLAPGGLLLNADHVPQSAPTTASWGRAFIDTWQAGNLGEAGAESWEQFWESARREPAFMELLAERERRFAGRRRARALPFDFHREALRTVGFQEIADVWRLHDDSVLLAMR
jgi:trans-aconitate methyltransferase